MTNGSEEVGADGTSAAERLRQALAMLSADPSSSPSATALCEIAGVSRTALYRYHSDILDLLRTVQNRLRRRKGVEQLALERLRLENQTLRLQQAEIASLVDHYFAAWQEATSLLRRREQDLAALRRSIGARPLALKR
jgi:AcrR family transcriptional regulator